ncbi:MAG: acetamidase [Lachnospiraceae bacterium]|nr:acetamidase [Lachnospiraceae bacterium]
MNLIPKTRPTYTFSKHNSPIHQAAPQDLLCFETYDCFTNRLLPPDATYENTPFLPGNPLTGPVFISGANPGDVLKIDIQKITPGPTGIVVVGPKSGCLREYFPERKILRIPVNDKEIQFTPQVRLPLRPMIGTIGVAPAGEAIPSVTPSSHGGNMDCTKITEGSTLYLPVFTPGALLSMGDVHAAMGDGEVEDCGLEIEARVTVCVDIIHTLKIDWPLLETEDAWISIASRDTMDEAWQAADRQMFDFLTNQVGIDPYEAGMLLTLTGNLAFCQTVNPKLTARMEFPKTVTKQYGFYTLTGQKTESIRFDTGPCTQAPQKNSTRERSND